MNTPEQTLTPREVAERLKVTERTVLNMLRDKQLEGTRDGRTKRFWKISAASVAAYQAQQQQGEGIV